MLNNQQKNIFQKQLIGLIPAVIISVICFAFIFHVDELRPIVGRAIIVAVVFFVYQTVTVHSKLDQFSQKQEQLSQQLDQLRTLLEQQPAVNSPHTSAPVGTNNPVPKTVKTPQDTNRKSDAGSQANHDTIFCPQCGTEQRSNRRICVNCGISLVDHM